MAERKEKSPLRKIGNAVGQAIVAAKMLSLYINPLTAHSEKDIFATDDTFCVIGDTPNETFIMMVKIIKAGLEFAGSFLDAPNPYRGFKEQKDAENVARELEQEADR